MFKIALVTLFHLNTRIPLFSQNDRDDPFSLLPSSNLSPRSTHSIGIPQEAKCERQPSSRRSLDSPSFPRFSARSIAGRTSRSFQPTRQGEEWTRSSIRLSGTSTRPVIRISLICIFSALCVVWARVRLDSAAPRRIFPACVSRRNSLYSSENAWDDLVRKMIRRARSLLVKQYVSVRLGMMR